MNLPEDRKRYKWERPATLENVEQVCSAAAQVFDQCALHKKDRFAVELLVREAINNAYLHGCSRDSRLSFSCELKITEQEVVIEVIDEGKGFNWRAQSECPPSNLGESGRGLCIYGLYADSIHFNDKGNCVSLTRIFNRGVKDD